MEAEKRAEEHAQNAKQAEALARAAGVLVRNHTAAPRKHHRSQPAREHKDEFVGKDPLASNATGTHVDEVDLEAAEALKAVHEAALDVASVIGPSSSLLQVVNDADSDSDGEEGSDTVAGISVVSPLEEWGVSASNVSAATAVLHHTVAQHAAAGAAGKAVAPDVLKLEKELAQLEKQLNEMRAMGQVVEVKEDASVQWMNEVVWTLETDEGDLHAELFFPTLVSQLKRGSYHSSMLTPAVGFAAQQMSRLGLMLDEASPLLALTQSNASSQDDDFQDKFDEAHWKAAGPIVVP